jgi:hypothetical protein
MNPTVPYLLCNIISHSTLLSVREQCYRNLRHHPLPNPLVECQLLFFKHIPKSIKISWH